MYIILEVTIINENSVSEYSKFSFTVLGLDLLKANMNFNSIMPILYKLPNIQLQCKQWYLKIRHISSPAKHTC